MGKVKANTTVFNGYVHHDLSIKDFNGFEVGTSVVSINRDYKPKDKDWVNKNVLVKVKALGKSCENLKGKILKGSEILFMNCELDDCEAWIDKEGNAKAMPVYNIGKISVLKEGEGEKKEEEVGDDLPF